MSVGFGVSRRSLGVKPQRSIATPTPHKSKGKNAILAGKTKQYYFQVLLF
jgi:hypothetical protein